MNKKKYFSIETLNFDYPCPPTLIGSLPLDNHKVASKLVTKYTPEIPLWVQLPYFKEEGMIEQFSNGIPCLNIQNNGLSINTKVSYYEKELVSFMEDYFEVSDNLELLDDSRFALKNKYRKGFDALLEEITLNNHTPKILKGQITGPLTFCYGIKDQNGRSILYNETLRDIVTKHLKMNACWQILKMGYTGYPVMIFIDEPILANFGSANLLGVTSDHVITALGEVINSIHKNNALAGIHICGNTDWSIIFNLNIDIVSFDAYNYFDKFILYSEKISSFINNGGILAWGIVPTASEDQIESINANTIFESWLSAVEQLTSLEIKVKKILTQSIITPTCGTGLLKPIYAKKVVQLTKEVSDMIRKAQILKYLK